MASSSSEDKTKANASDAELREQLGVIREDLQELGRKVGDVVGNRVARAREASADTVERGKERVTEYGDDLIENIRSRPLRAVFIAAGIGTLLGLFFGPRRG